MILTVTLNAAIDKRYVVSDLCMGEVNRVTECVYTAGGKGLNVARAIKTTGKDAITTGFVGGYAGDFIVNELTESGIPADFIKVSGESRSCINIYDENNKTQTEFLEPGITISEEDTAGFIAKYDELLKKCEVVAISGSVPKGTGNDVYPILVKKAKDLGKKVIVDTSGALLTEIVKHGPNMIKPNVDETKMLTGKEINETRDIIDAGERLVRSGIEQVVISLGANGSILVREEGTYKAIVPRIEAVNTVGCGDCMTAGFAIAFEEKMSPEDSLRYASAISAAAAMTDKTGCFYMDDFNDIQKKIVIEKIK